MAVTLQELHVRNYRCLADVRLEPRPINVLFGPNGSGKSTLLDVMSFLHDCITRDLSFAIQQRAPVDGLASLRAGELGEVGIRVVTPGLSYQMAFYSRGMTSSPPGEELRSLREPPRREPRLIYRREATTDSATVFGDVDSEDTRIVLRDRPFELVIDQVPDANAGRMSDFLRTFRRCSSREFRLPVLRFEGSPVGAETRLDSSGANGWSVLRNLDSVRARDDRYGTVLRWMRRAFATSFDGIVVEQSGPSRCVGSFLEKGLRQPIPASGASDAHLQMLLLLLALYGEEPDKPAILLFDEPETSLHPWAIHIFAEAVKEATQDWCRQVFIATHSPVLLSQFEPAEILCVTKGENGTQVQWLDEREDIADLLEEFGAGGLYMAEAIGQQGGETVGEGQVR